METLSKIKYDVHRVPFSKVRQLSSIDIAYSEHPDRFSDFIEHTPDLQGLLDAVEARSKFQTNRAALVEALKEQYDDLGIEHDGFEQLLEPNHFTVTTAHQPSLLTGPLYFVYKICSAIRLSRTINDQTDRARIHPVFVLGGEDHDLEEMDHAHFFNKTFKWETDQQGSVGRMHTDELLPLLEEIKEVLGTQKYSDELRSIITKSFVPGRTYGKAMQHFVISLFDETELVVINLDHPGLKAQFTDVIRDELYRQTSSELIRAAQERIESAGFKPQAYVRDINFFYLDDGMRNRIISDNGSFQVVDTAIDLSSDEIDALVDKHPDRFSPNVNMRPLYQETVLPNIAYIGGGGELAYWLERKTQFEHFDVPFPVLVRRNSVVHLNSGLHKQRVKLDIPLQDLFADPEKEISKWIRLHAEHDIDISDQLNTIDAALQEIVSKAEEISPSFAKKVAAFQTKTLKDVEHMGKRLVREEKQLNETRVNQIRKFFDRILPGNGLQERHENFIPNYLAHGKAYFQMLIDELNPLEPGFIILEELPD